MSGCRQALRAAIAKLFGIRRRSEEQPVPHRRGAAQRGARRTPEPPSDDVHTVPGYYIALAAQPGPVRVGASMRRWARRTPRRRPGTSP
jgi:hypothetical protein